MSDAKVHIVTCSNFECEKQYARMCEDLETRGVVCIMEGRGGYGIGSTFVEKFKEMVESTLVTIIHLCPHMISRLANLSDVLQGHQRQKYLFIHVESTPQEIPTVYKDVTKMLLINDSYRKKIIEKVLEIVQQAVSASSATELIHTSPSEVASFSPLSSTSRQDDDCYLDSGIRAHSPLREHDRFILHQENQQSRDTGVYLLSSKIQYKAHHLLKWSSKRELQEMCRNAPLYDSNNRSNTVRCLLTKVLPEIFAKKNIPAIAELLAVPVSVVQNKVLTKLRDILLSTKPEDIDRSDLQSAEKALFECCLTQRDFIDPVFVPNLICTYLLTVVYLAVFQDIRHSSLDTMIKRVKQYISQPGQPLGDISAFVDDIRKRTDDVAKAVTAIRTNWKHLSSVKKRSWPVQFCMVLGTLIEVFHGDPETALAALETFPLLMKPGKPRPWNVLHNKKPHERVVQMVTMGMVAYLNALGDKVGEDIAERANSAFTALGLSLKYLDRSMYGMARCLLFSQSPVIRQGAMILWKDANDDTTDSLMVTEVMTHLQPISVNLAHKQPTNHSTSSASWKVASTRIGSDKIMIHVNLPSEEAKLKRSKQSLSKSEDCGHLTTVEILRALSKHPHILSLWAYRIDQFPVFYVTEDYSQQNFQKVLYYSARNEAWFQPLELMQLLLQALEAVIALHEHGFIQRDLTAASFAYIKQSKSVRLYRFNLAREWGRDDIFVDRECSSIPMRWSAPESLKQHYFSMRSDYWMVGHLIYEVITHGCLPYSDLQGHTESSIENLIKEDRKKLLQERCIPTSVFDVIQNCTRFDDTHRMSVCEAKSRLEETYDRYVSFNDPPENRSFVTSAMFPGLDRTSFQGLPKKDSERDDGYGDVYYPPYYVAAHEYQNCEEDPLYTSIVDTSYPGPLYEDVGPGIQLKESQRMDLLCRNLTQTEESQLNTENIPGIYGHVKVEKRNQREYLVYSLPIRHCDPLSNVMDVLGSVLWSVKYIRCLSAVAKTLSSLHQRKWIHGCLCADNVWISRTEDEDDYKVYFSGLGYIRRSRDTQDGVIADESFVVPQDEHVYRRSPPEVIRDGTYSWASDVFSFGLIMWHGFFTISLYRNLKDLNKLETIPKVKSYEYLTTTSGNQILPKPARCPDTVYSLMLLCWSPERHDRPPMTHIEQKLLEYISEKVRRDRDRDQYDSYGQSSDDQFYDSPDNDSGETKVSNSYNSMAESSLETDRLHPSFSTQTQERDSTTAFHQQRQNPKTSQAQESGLHNTVSTLEHDGSRSSVVSTNVVVDKNTALHQENAKKQNTSHYDPFPKSTLKPNALPNNEKQGKEIQMKAFIAGSTAHLSCTQNTDSTDIVGKTKRNEKPRLPPKPKHLRGKTQVASSSDDQSEELYDDFICYSKPPYLSELQ